MGLLALRIYIFTSLEFAKLLSKISVAFIFTVITDFSSICPCSGILVAILSSHFIEDVGCRFFALLFCFFKKFLKGIGDIL